MNYTANEKQSLQMIRSFVEHEIDAQTFVQHFFDLRKKNIKHEQAIKKTWDKPYDHMLIDALKRGEISRDEFSRKWNNLFGWSQKEKQWLDMRDRIFTACDAFVSEPALSTNPAYEYSEYQLRDFVAKELREYEGSQGQPKK